MPAIAAVIKCPAQYEKGLAGMDGPWGNEGIAGEFETLFETGATREALGACPQLISELSKALGREEATRAIPVRAVEAVLRKAIQQYAAGTNTTVEHVQAANELLGWTTHSHEEIRAILAEVNEFGSKTHAKLSTVDLTSLGVRAALAGAQFSERLKSQRAVRDRRPKIAKYLSNAVHDVLEDKIAMRELAAQFGEDSEADRGQDLNKSLQSIEMPVEARRRLSRRTIGAIVGAATIGVVATALAWLQAAVEISGQEGVQISQPTVAAPAPFVRQATVRYTEGKGLNTFLGPGNTYPRGNPLNFAENQVIAVVCQDRNGQSVHDPTGDPNRYAEPWSVWNKLSNGLWVSDLYTDLPKVPGDTPPDKIPRC
ncbi:MAG: hypothetical protein ACRDTA_19495 [Pseudonocardiaceae bacterium]